MNYMQKFSNIFTGANVQIKYGGVNKEVEVKLKGNKLESKMEYKAYQENIKPNIFTRFFYEKIYPSDSTDTIAKIISSTGYYMGIQQDVFDGKTPYERAESIKKALILKWQFDIKRLSFFLALMMAIVTLIKYINK